MDAMCRICIEVVDNGFTVEIPDIDAMNKAEAAAKKKGPGSPMPYMGDMKKEYVAKSVDEVLAILKPALKNLPQMTYDEAFAEAAADDMKHP